MPKNQYRFDPESVNFEKERKSVLRRIFLTLGFITTATIMGFIAFWIFSLFMQTPLELSLRSENQELKSKYKLLSKKMQNMNKVLNDLQNRDDNLYRFLLNTDPIPAELRSSSMLQNNKYEELELLNKSEIIEKNTENLEHLVNKAYVQSKSLDEIEKLANEKKKKLTSIPAIMPIRKELLRSRPSGYGRRLHPIYGVWKMHTGMDFSAPSGSNIYATADGIVKKVKKLKSGYGIHVVIQHHYGGYETLYAHMIRAKVKRGDRVKRGDIIGYVGNTGTSTAPHVHYEVRKNGHHQNPINYYTNDLTPEEYEKIIHDTNNSVQSFD